MSYITITNTFTSGAVASSGQVNQNFSDITAGLSDGTKDVHVRDLSITSAIVTGNITVGKTTFENWQSDYSVIQIGGGSIIAHTTQSENSILSLYNNAYLSGGNEVYAISNARTSLYKQYQGAHYFTIAASGSAGGVITFADHMRLTVSQTRLMSTSTSGALWIDYTTDKLYSDILKTTQATAVAIAALYVNLSTGEIFSTSAS